MEDNKKKGLGMVLEGGGMRGLYTAGVLDELMEQGIYADSTVGVSAGAIFGCNYKSRQIGRTLRYNTRFCKDKRYMGIEKLDHYRRSFTAKDFCIWGRCPGSWMFLTQRHLPDHP